LTASLKGRTAIGKKIGDWRWIRMIGERRFWNQNEKLA
jgi:hypothetical protein